MITDNSGEFRFTGKHMLGVVALFFGTIIAVNLTLAWFASHSWTGLVVQNTYVESQNFNKQTAERQAASLLGWKASTDYDLGTFSLKVTNTKANPPAVENISVKIGRTIHEDEDHVLVLQAMGGNQFSSPIQLAKGLWEANVTITASSGQEWEKAFRFVVKE